MFTIRCANKYKSESTNCKNTTEISQISEACDSFNGLNIATVKILVNKRKLIACNKCFI